MPRLTPPQRTALDIAERMVLITVAGWRCTRCAHEWVPRRPDPPRTCPGCKSPYWDRPRRKDL